MDKEARARKNIELLKRLKAGEQVEEELFALNLPLVTYITKKFAGYDYAELFSCGQEGLYKGIKTFKFDKGANFSSYAARCIENEILLWIRKQKRIISREVSLDAKVSHDDDNDLSIGDLIADKDDWQERIDDASVIATIKQIIKVKLSDRQAKVFRGICIYGKSQQQLATELHTSRQNISAINARAIEIIKNEYMLREEGWQANEKVDYTKVRRKQGYLVPGGATLSLLQTEEGRRKLEYVMRYHLNESEVKLVKIFLDSHLITLEDAAKKFGFKRISTLNTYCWKIDKKIEEFLVGKGVPTTALVETKYGEFVELDARLARLVKMKRKHKEIRLLANAILTPRQLQIIQYRYFDEQPKTQAETAKLLKVKYIGRVEEKAVSRLLQGYKMLEDSLAKGEELNDVLAKLKEKFKPQLSPTIRRRNVDSKSIFVQENMEYLQAIIPLVLSERWRYIIEQRYLSATRKTCDAIAKECGVSKTVIVRQEGSALALLKKCLDNNYSVEQLKSGLPKKEPQKKPKKIKGLDVTVLEAFSDDEKCAILKRAMTLILTPRQIEIVNARYFSQVPSQEIAKNMNINSVTVNRELSFSVRALKQFIEGGFDEQNLPKTKEEEGIQHHREHYLKISRDQRLVDLLLDEKSAGIIKNLAPLVLTPQQMTILQARYFAPEPIMRTKLAQEMSLAKTTIAEMERRAVARLLEAYQNQS